MPPTPALLLCEGGTSPVLTAGSNMPCNSNTACPEASECRWDTSNSQRICCKCPRCPDCGPSADCVCGKCVLAPTPSYSCPSGNFLANADGSPQFCAMDQECSDGFCQIQGAGTMQSFTFVPVQRNRGVCCPCPSCQFNCMRGQICECGKCVQAPTPAVVCSDGNSPINDDNGGFVKCDQHFVANTCPQQSTCQALTTGSYCCPCPPCRFACMRGQTCECGKCVQAPTPSVLCADGQSPLQSPAGGPQTCSPQSNLMMLRSQPSCPESSSCQMVGIYSYCCPCKPCIEFCVKGSTCQCGKCVPSPTPQPWDDFPLPSPTPRPRELPSPTPQQGPTASSPTPRFTIGTIADLSKFRLNLANFPTPAPTRALRLSLNTNFATLLDLKSPTPQPPR